MPPLPVGTPDGRVTSTASPGADHVDVVADPERSGEQLVTVAVELDCALLTAYLRPDTALGWSAEAPRRYLLTGEHRLRGDQVAELLGPRDCARNDLATDDTDLRQEVVRQNLCARRVDGNVLDATSTVTCVSECWTLRL